MDGSETSVRVQQKYTLVFRVATDRGGGIRRDNANETGQTSQSKIKTVKR